MEIGKPGLNAEIGKILRNLGVCVQFGIAAWYCSLILSYWYSPVWY